MATACSDGPDGGAQVAEHQSGLDASSVVQAASASGRYIVKFKNAAAGKSGLAGAGIAVALDLSARHNAVAAVMTPQQAAGLANNPNVVLVEEDPVRQPLAYADSFPGDWPASQGIPYGIDMVQANDTAVAQTGPATNVSVCIIDSGYLAAHEDRRESDGTIVVNGYSGVDNTASSDWNVDGDGHGTHVAGTIAGAGDNGVGVVGVLPLGVNLSIVRVFGDDGLWGYFPYTSGDPLYGSELAHAMGKCQELQQPGTKLVVSMSLGGGAASQIEEDAFEAAYNAKNTIVIAAAGNDGNSALSYPASYPSVVSVGAVDADENYASFSQYNVQVEVSAPGVGVMSTISHSGTGSVASSALLDDLAANAVAGTPDTSASGATGELVDGGNCASPPSGKNRRSWRNKIVLCARDGATYFQTMVDSAGSAGARAVVIRNHNQSGGGALSVTATGSIPGVGVNFADGESLVDIAGETVTVTATTLSPDPQGYTAYGGTSMATPHVSGVAALLWQKNPNITSQQLRTALRDAAHHPLVANDIDVNYGHGIIKAADAHAYLSGPCAVEDANGDLPCADGDECTWNRCVDVSGVATCLPSVAACVVEGPPEIVSITPPEGEQGRSVPVEMLGHDFRLDATLTIDATGDGTGVTLSDPTWYDTTKLSATFHIASDASLGEHIVTFTHVDAAGNPIESASKTFMVIEGTCSSRGASCTSGSDCCSGSCGGKPGRRTCK
jgi:subtilisin family serine protease